ncbi:hypothetical protein [Amycolatopsis sp. NPDC051903]|uniref:hypothetical protein n=1 Tax=Amycolatopsis sp. NPDC051903 TaxID=3363936 RepID=UPI00379FD3B8
MRRASEASVARSTWPTLPSSWPWTAAVVEALVSIGRPRDGQVLVDRAENLWNKAHDTNPEPARTTSADLGESYALEVMVLAINDEPHGFADLGHGLRAHPNRRYQGCE